MNKSIGDTIILRKEPGPDDPAIINEIIRSTGFFREDEVQVAIELVAERLEKGVESGYEFIFADLVAPDQVNGRTVGYSGKTIGDSGRTVGYACFGLIPCTLHSYDLYWIATHKDFMHRGIGRKLLEATESAISELGGTGIYVETSSRELYAPTRTFYEKNAYLIKARFEDFYDQGDDKIVYVKYVQGSHPREVDQSGK